MSSKQKENLRDLLSYELDGIAKRGDINKESLDNVYKLVKSIKGLDMIIKKEKGESEEESGGGGYSLARYSRYMPMGYGPYMDGGRGSYANNSYAGGNYNNSNDGGNSMMNSNANNSNQNSNYGGNSNRGSYDDGNSYEGNSNAGRQGRDGDGDGRYSEARGRDSRGRFTSRDYSRHTEKERMIEQLEKMMQTAQTEQEREAIKRCIEDME